MNKKCKHERLKSQCKECGGSQICEHGRRKSSCKECGGSQICEHGRQKNYCKECGGKSICEHKRIKSYCKECGGSQMCEHRRIKSKCKECGFSTRHFLKGSFTINQLKEIGSIKICQFPNCLIQSNSLNSDHYHDGQKINPNNYRGEICYDHNILLASLDKFPEEASINAIEYMKRRPYKQPIKEII